MAGIGPTNEIESAEALDGLAFVSVNGIWDESSVVAETISHTGSGTPQPAILPCTAVGQGSGNAIVVGPQSNDPGTENQFRYGSPSATSGCGNVTARSGLGFAGEVVAGGTVLGSAPFDLGRITHYNNPISGIVAESHDIHFTVNLNTTFTFLDLTTNPSTPVTLSPVFEVDFYETRNDASVHPGGVCPFGGDSDGCFDQIEISPATSPSVNIGGTTVSIDISAFVPTVGGECDSNATATSTFITPEGGSTTACAIGVALTGNLVIEKISVGGDASFDFDYTELSQIFAQVGTPVANNAGSTTVSTGGGTGSAVLNDVVPGMIRVEETVPVGWELESFSCDDPNESYGNFDAASHLTGNGPIVDLDSAETVTCSFTNRKNPTITIVKNGTPSSTDTFDFTTESNLGGIDTDGNADPTADDQSLPVAFDLAANGDSETFTVNPGTFSVTETVTDGWQLDSLSCSVNNNASGNATAAQAGDTPVADIDVSWGDDVTCIFNNEQDATIVLTKQSTGSDGTFTFTGDLAGDITTSGGAGTTTLSAAVAAGTYTSTETIPTGWDLNSVVCDDANSSGDPAAGTAIFVAEPGETVTCTFTNSRQMASVVLQKEWVDGQAGDTAELTVAGPAGNNSNASTATGAAGSETDDVNTAALTVNTGDTVDLTEALDTPENYEVSLACDGTNAPTMTGNDGSLVIAPTDSGNDITCTFTNTRKSVELTLQKEWVDGRAGETAALSAIGESGNPTATSTATGAAGSEVDTTNTATLTVFAGETVVLSELPLTNATHYTSALTCDGAGAVTNGGTAGDVAIISDDTNGDEVACTFTNTRRSTEVTLAKDWVNPGAADEADLTITSAGASSQAATAIAPANSGTSPETTSLTVFAGENVILAETLAGANTAAYDVTNFTCDTASPTWADGATTASFSVTGADTAEPIDCSFENTARRGTITVIKVIDGFNRVFDFTGDWLDPEDFNITTTGPRPGSGSVTFQDVLVGSYTVSELDLSPGFGTTVMCADSDPTGTASSPDQTTAQLDGTINLDAGETVTCTYTNTENSTVVIIKDAIPGGEQDFTFTTDLPDAAGSFDLDDDADATLSNTYTEVNVVPGAYTVTEDTLGGWDLTGLSCTDSFDDGTDSTTDLASGEVTLEVDAGETVTCTYTNTRKSAELTLTKEWGQAFDDDTISLEATGIDGTANGSSTAPSTTTDAVLTIFSDETIDLSEAFTTGSASAYNTGLACDDDAGEAVPGLTYTGGGLDGTFDVATDPVDITCTFTNAGVAGLDIDKTFVSATDADLDGTYDVVYAVTVSNNGAGSAIYDLVDTPSFDSDLTVVSGSATVTGGPAGPIAAFIDPWTLAQNEAIAGTTDPTNPTEHVYTLTFVVNASAVIADPNLYTECGAPGAAGEGLFNLATLTFGQESFPAEDCGDIDFPELTITKTFSDVIGPTVDDLYTVSYDVIVENTGDIDSQYNLVDNANFSPGLSIDLATALVTGAGAPPTPALWQSNPWTLADDAPIAVGEVHTFTLQFIVFGTDLIADPTLLVECGVDPVAGEGLFNEATLTYAGNEISDDDCGEPPIPELSIEKTITETAGPDADGKYTVGYDIVVQNVGNGETAYWLSDHPEFDSDLMIDSGSATATGGPGDPADYPGSNPWELASVQLIAGTDDPASPVEHVYSLTFIVDGSAILDGSATVTECGQTPVAGEGLFNEATLSYNSVVIDDSDCGEPGVPNLSIDKTFVSAVDADSDGIYTVIYTIEVANSSTEDANYDLTDTPDFDDDLTIDSAGFNQDLTSDSTLEQDDVALAGIGPWALASGQDIAAGVTDIYSLTVEVDATALIEPNAGVELTECSTQDPSADEGLFNSATVSYAGTQDTDDDCGEPPLPDLRIDKTFGSATDDDADGIYTVTYTVTVVNSGDASTVYDLNDTPGFDSDLVVDGTPTATAATDGANDPSPVGAYANPVWPLAADQQIDTAETHTFELTFEVNTTALIEPIDPGTVLDRCEPQGPSEGEGLFNEASLIYLGNEIEAEDCDDPDLPNLDIEKAFVSATDADADGIYDVLYSITVSNTGPGATVYDLEDNPSFDTGLTIVTGSATVTGGPAAPAGYGLNPWILATDQAIAGTTDPAMPIEHVFTLTFEVNARGLVLNPSSYDECEGATGEAGQGLFNDATLRYAGTDIDAEDCGDIDAPEVEIDKTFVSAVGPAADNTYVVTYSVEVANVGTAAAVYDLSDGPDPDPDLMIVSATFDQDLATDGSLEQDDTVLPATPSWTLATDLTIAAGVTDTYTIKVIVDGSRVIATPSEYGECSPFEGAGTGLFNLATLTFSGTNVAAEDCGDIGIPVLTIDKTVVSSTGPSTTGEYVVGYTVTVANTGDAATIYDLTDTPGFDTDLTIVGTPTAISTTDGANDPTPVGIYADPDWPLADDATIDPDETHSYVLTFVVDGTALIEDPELLDECTPGDSGPGEGLFNSSLLTYNGQELDDNDCIDPGVPVVNITKTITSVSDDDADGFYDVSYDIVVENLSDEDTTYDLTDAPGFDSDLTIDGSPTATATTDGANDPEPVGTYAAPDWPLATGAAIDAGETHTYTLDFAIDATALIEPINPSAALDVCNATEPVAGEGLFNEAALEYAGVTRIDEDCGDPELPDLDIEKTFVSATDADTDGIYTVIYEIMVTSAGNAATTYDLVDTAGFDADLTITGTPTATATTTGANNPEPVGAYATPDWPLAADQTIDGGEQHLFTLTYEVDATGVIGGTGEIDVCVGVTGEEGQALFNAATLSYAGTDTDAEDCGEILLPELTIEKSALSVDDADGDGIYDAVYTVTVTSTGADTSYDLEDNPAFDSDISIVSASATAIGGPAAPIDYPGNNPWVLATGEAITAGTVDSPTVHVYTLTFVADATAIADNPALFNACSPEAAAGEGLFNAATLIYTGEILDDDACVDVVPGELEITKTVTSAPTLVSGRIFDIGYEIVVSNTGEGTSIYTLTDEFKFAAGMVVLNVDTTNTVPGDIATDGAFDGAANQLLAENITLTAGESHIYTVTVRADTAFVTNTHALDCTIDDGEDGTGFMNEASVGPTADDCAEIPSPPPPPPLPKTGSDTRTEAILALLMIALGAALVGFSKRSHTVA